MAIDKYELLHALKEYLDDDDECSSFCMECEMAEPCEKLRIVATEIFQP